MIVRASTLLGLAVMDAIERGEPVNIGIHRMHRDERDRLLEQLGDLGLRRDDNPENGWHKGGRLDRINVDLWPSRDTA